MHKSFWHVVPKFLAFNKPEMIRIRWIHDSESDILVSLLIELLTGRCKKDIGIFISNDTLGILSYRQYVYIRTISNAIISSKKNLRFWKVSNRFKTKSPVQSGDLCVGLIIDQQLIKEIKWSSGLHFSQIVSHSKYLTILNRNFLQQRNTHSLTSQSEVMNSPSVCSMLACNISIPNAANFDYIAVFIS